MLVNREAPEAHASRIIRERNLPQYVEEEAIRLVNNGIRTLGLTNTSPISDYVESIVVSVLRNFSSKYDPKLLTAIQRVSAEENQETEPLPTQVIRGRKFMSTYIKFAQKLETILQQIGGDVSKSMLIACCVKQSIGDHMKINIAIDYLLLNRRISLYCSKDTRTRMIHLETIAQAK
jgi:hypothetical protein